MALQIPLDPLGSGIACSYWRITSAHLDFCQRQATIWLHGWRDGASRAAGHAPGAALHFALSGEDFGDQALAGGTASALYGALKRRAAASKADDGLERAITPLGHEAFAGAVDC